MPWHRITPQSTLISVLCRRVDLYRFPLFRIVVRIRNRGLPCFANTAELHLVPIHLRLEEMLRARAWWFVATWIGLKGMGPQRVFSHVSLHPLKAQCHFPRKRRKISWSCGCTGLSLMKGKHVVTSDIEKKSCTCKVVKYLKLWSTEKSYFTGNPCPHNKTFEDASQALHQTFISRSFTIIDGTLDVRPGMVTECNTKGLDIRLMDRRPPQVMNEIIMRFEKTNISDVFDQKFWGDEFGLETLTIAKFGTWLLWWTNHVSSFCLTCWFWS